MCLKILCVNLQNLLVSINNLLLDGGQEDVSFSKKMAENQTRIRSSNCLKKNSKLSKCQRKWRRKSDPGLFTKDSTFLSVSISNKARKKTYQLNQILFEPIFLVACHSIVLIVFQKMDGHRELSVIVYFLKLGLSSFHGSPCNFILKNFAHCFRHEKSNLGTSVQMISHVKI